MANTNPKRFQKTFLVSAPVLLLVVSFVKPVLGQQPNSEISLVAVSSIAGDAPDRSNLGGMKRPVSMSDSVADPNAMSDETFEANIFGGISAADWSGKGDQYWLLSDRGPLDGAVDWPCRLHRVRVNVSDAAVTNGLSKPSVEIIETVFLKDEYGNRFTGLASAFTASPKHPARLDPEGLRVSPQGTFYISDEYGPRLLEFSRSGQLIRELEVPSHYQVRCPGRTWLEENPKNETGRQANRGMEGLAISSDGSKLFGIMQSPLLQDCQRLTKEEKPNGLSCRLPVFSSSGGLEGEYVYLLDGVGLKLNEILECGRNQLITIERDGKSGAAAKTKNLMLISLQGATNIADRSQELSGQLPAVVHAVRKRVLLDLLDPKWNLAGDQMPEKIESLTFGPDLKDGRRLLIVVSDNDFESDHPTMIYAFAIPRNALGFDQPMVSANY